MDGAAEIRSLDLRDVERLIEWAAAEGWNPGLDDAAPFHAADPSGFLGCFVDGEMVAGISAIRYGSGFGFIGLYICRPDRRGKGYGKRVWDAGMAHLDGRTIGLDGVPEQQANYASMGFSPVYRTYRWSGRRAPATDARIATIEISDGLVSQVTAFDRQFFPAGRDGFLRQWLGAPRLARAVLRDGAVVGYGVVRRCREGFKIGPLFAEDQPTALALLAALAETCAGEPFHLDVPETNSGFSDLLADAGMERGFVTARMYRGPAPHIRQDGVFAVTTLELG